ncbi:hypothetical protein TYRP_016675 [Tyrophagus putrescentiae]|nr:hypothetical protein TYRP_016675 [Tyrophagus putrescentiae]
MEQESESDQKKQQNFLLNLVMCNTSARNSMHYDLDRVVHVNESLSTVAQRLALQQRVNGGGGGSASGGALGSKLPSQVYHVFYSSASSDSIIYILAILCIYFLLFSLLIYANWNTFNHYNHRKKSRRQQRRQLRKQQQQQQQQQQQMLLPPLSSSTPRGALDSVVCLSDTSPADGTLPERKASGSRKEPTGSHTTTLIINHPGKVVNI